ncbi:hypothetical protein BGZ60DRAFT_433347 [Tricladium varicosporioides]|nr:hypothetical protein BGZ60DRAFT_433347 [Hymenoscyphus varicosporioides]
MDSRSDEAKIQNGWVFMTESRIDGCSPVSPPLRISVRSASESLAQGFHGVRENVIYMKKPSKSDSIRHIRRRSNTFNKLPSSNEGASSKEAGTESSHNRQPYKEPDKDLEDLKPAMEVQSPNYVCSSTISVAARPRNQIPRSPMDGLDMSSLRSLELGILKDSTDDQLQEHIATCKKYRDFAYEAKTKSRIGASESTKDKRPNKQHAVYAESRRPKQAEPAGKKENQTPNELDHDCNSDESPDDEIVQ